MAKPISTAAPARLKNVAIHLPPSVKSRRTSHLAQHPTLAPTAPLAKNDQTNFVKQPNTRPISEEQLIAEVKGIYAGLVMVESKCIEVDNNQAAQSDVDSKLNPDQWQALIALHRTLLHEHHDFFLASQHPAANPALRRLAAKYAMPARMWRHGIHSFLEVLRHRLPASLDYMLTFIYMAYSIIALLYETVPAFEDTWIECLGDLGRYRMAIEDDDIRDREVWTAVSRHWYSKASDKAPTTGRLYHHLAILARPNACQQLYYYSKSLCVDIPFLSARDSFMTLFDPILSRTPNTQQAKLPPTELSYVKTHAILFSGRQIEELEPTMGTFLHLLDNHIGRSTRRWLGSGYHVGISNTCAVTGYGHESNPITIALRAASRRRPNTITTTPSGPQEDQPMQDASSEVSSTTTTYSKLVSNTNQLPNALRLFTSTYDIVSRRFGDPNILTFLHVSLVFVRHLTFRCPDDAMPYLAPHFPWKLTALMLNTLLESSPASTTSSSTTSSSTTSSASAAASTVASAAAFSFSVTLAAPSPSAVGSPSSSSSLQYVSKPPAPAVSFKAQGQGLSRLLEEGAPLPGDLSSRPVGAGGSVGGEQLDEQRPGRRGWPLPDDFALRGLPWAESYLPEDWFVRQETIDDDDKYFELTSMTKERRERVLWLGARIAEDGAGKWLRVEEVDGVKRFTVSPEFDVDLKLEVPAVAPGESVEYGELPDAGAVPARLQLSKTAGRRRCGGGMRTEGVKILPKR